MTQDLKVGIVGYGFATRTFHAPLVAAVPGLALTAIASSDPAKVTRDWPGLDTETSPEALFARPDLDLVVIPTPNASHFPLAQQALAAGKHVVVDKPFTLTLAEARALKVCADQAGRVLSVFHNRRHDADFLTVRQLLAEGTLGPVQEFESHFDRHRPAVRDRWREKADLGGGLWFDLGSHLLDQALQLFGVPEAIGLDLAWQREGTQADDYFQARLHYGQTRIVLHASALVPRPGPRFSIHGTRGSFVKYGLDVQEDQLKAGLRPPAPGWGVDPLPGTLTVVRDEVAESRVLPSLPGDYPAYYAALRDAILGRGANPVPPEQAIQVMGLIELGRRSCEQRRTLDVKNADLAFEPTGA
jgi:predicted dehydrogenase